MTYSVTETQLTLGRSMSVLRHEVFWLSFASFLVLYSLKTSNKTPTFSCYRLTYSKTNTNDFPSKPNKYHIDRQQDVKNVLKTVSNTVQGQGTNIHKSNCNKKIQNSQS